ncbi:ATP-binding protein [Pseudomaricurvus sp. HS19]|uniref:ATP-binding protein n=1 Tax=Pseudomaricurvus sp. HS19 TaxID=2692626 RepID=UPI0013710A6D|nr:ATP-binding protein [Pseudomaricurvus sp. HS19]MYM63169.1 sensor histidine kinase [Pseudomaricurvus sp. HS19]
MNLATLTSAAPEQNLQRLLTIRGLLLLILCVSFAVCYWWLQLALPYRSLLWLFSGMTLINLVALLQLRIHGRASQLAFFTQLLIDVVAITLLLYFTGGASNPFVSYYLVPLCIAAATLPGLLTWPLVIAALCLYSSLFFVYIPLPEVAPMAADAHQHHHQGAATVNLHTLGMWINFLVSAGLITLFVGRMAASLRQQDEALARLREEQLRDQQLMALATLAAGTAHELGSPLTTMRTLLAELLQDCREQQLDPSSLQQDLELLQRQANHCSQSLQQLGREAGQLRDGVTPQVSLRQLCRKTLDHWLLLRPEVEAQIRIGEGCDEVEVNWPVTVTQAITNLLNNAADANSKGIEIDVRWDQRQFLLSLHDQGAGVPDDIARQLAQPFVSHKGEGRGLGLFLTNAVITRFGGELSLHPHPAGGTLTELKLPLKAATTTRAATEARHE